MQTGARFARISFTIAATTGALSIVPMYIFFPGSYVYYGSLSGLAAWQVAFAIIARDPIRFRPLMIPAAIEKLLWVVTMIVLGSIGRMTPIETMASIPVSLALGVLFIVSYVRTPR